MGRSPPRRGRGDGGERDRLRERGEILVIRIGGGALGILERHPIDDSGIIGIGLQIRTHDLDADGDLDLAFAGKSGTYILFNEGR